MKNLFWRTRSGCKGLLPTPFKTEDEFEKAVFESTGLLEDIFLIKRQVRGGGKPGIPDIIGVDGDGNICIIEMKNVEVDAAIIPQVLQYAIWAERSPDSIRVLLSQCKDAPEDLKIDWQSFKVRIIVVAPSILPSTLEVVDKINYEVDLLEISRWIEGDNHFLLVNRLETDEKKPRPKPVAGLASYDEDFYKGKYNPQSAVLFMQLAREVEKLVNKKGWNLEQKFNKFYCGFKAGFFNAFGIKWIGTKTLAFFFKLSEREAKKIGVKYTKYEKLWKEVYVYVEPGKTKVSQLMPLFEAAYKKLSAE